MGEESKFSFTNSEVIWLEMEGIRLCQSPRLDLLNTSLPVSAANIVKFNNILVHFQT